ncbi:hypothetical protein CCP4SC76_3010006 [Gammaproteobacteria bacterium]
MVSLFMGVERRLGAWQNLFDRVEQIIARHGLDQPAGGPGGLAFSALAGLGFGGEYQDRHKAKGGQLADLLDQFEAAHAGHVDVRDDEIRLGTAPKTLERLLTVFRFLDLEPSLGQDVMEAHEYRRGIIYQMDGLHRVSSISIKISTDSRHPRV